MEPLGDYAFASNNADKINYVKNLMIKAARPDKFMTESERRLNGARTLK